MIQLTPTQERAVAELRYAGWPLCLIPPDKLDGVNIDRLESRLSNDANEHIEDLLADPS